MGRVPTQHPKVPRTGPSILKMSQTSSTTLSERLPFTLKHTKARAAPPGRSCPLHVGGKTNLKSRWFPTWKTKSINTFNDLPSHRNQSIALSIVNINRSSCPLFVPPFCWRLSVCTCGIGSPSFLNLSFISRQHH